MASHTVQRRQDGHRNDFCSQLLSKHCTKIAVSQQSAVDSKQCFVTMIRNQSGDFKYDLSGI